MKVNLFGGKDAIEQNALMQTFQDVADDDNGKSIYEWLERIPKTSMVVELIDKLHELGFKIIKIK